MMLLIRYMIHSFEDFFCIFNQQYEALDVGV
jgi:hypothetical protein